MSHEPPRCTGLKLSAPWDATRRHSGRRTREACPVGRDLEQPARARGLGRVVAGVEPRENAGAELRRTVPAPADGDPDLAEIPAEGVEAVPDARAVADPVLPLVGDDLREARVDIVLFARMQRLVLRGEDADKRIGGAWLVHARGVVCDGAGVGPDDEGQQGERKQGHCLGRTRSMATFL